MKLNLIAASLILAMAFSGDANGQGLLGKLTGRCCDDAGATCCDAPAAADTCCSGRGMSISFDINFQLPRLFNRCGQRGGMFGGCGCDEGAVSADAGCGCDTGCDTGCGGYDGGCGCRVGLLSRLFSKGCGCGHRNGLVHRLFHRHGCDSGCAMADTGCGCDGGCDGSCGTADAGCGCDGGNDLGCYSSCGCDSGCKLFNGRVLARLRGLFSRGCGTCGDTCGCDTGATACGTGCGCDGAISAPAATPMMEKKEGVVDPVPAAPAAEGSASRNPVVDPSAFIFRNQRRFSIN